MTLEHFTLVNSKYSRLILLFQVLKSFAISNK